MSFDMNEKCTWLVVKVGNLYYTQELERTDKDNNVTSYELVNKKELAHLFPNEPEMNFAKNMADVLGGCVEEIVLSVDEAFKQRIKKTEYIETENSTKDLEELKALRGIFKRARKYRPHVMTKNDYANRNPFKDILNQNVRVYVKIKEVLYLLDKELNKIAIKEIPTPEELTGVKFIILDKKQFDVTKSFICDPQNPSPLNSEEIDAYHKIGFLSNEEYKILIKIRTLQKLEE